LKPFDLIIRHGSVVTPSGVEYSDIGVRAGKIEEIALDLNADGEEEIDAWGQHVLPGLIDAHVHVNEPGRAEWETWTTASSALAAGGGTLLCDMPLNAHPPTLDAASFDAKARVARRESFTDFALWGGLTPGNLDKLEELAERGVIGFKAFMSNSGIDDFEAADDVTLLEGMRQAAVYGLPVAVHAENDAITRALSQIARSEGLTSVRDYFASRPPIAEIEAISRALLFAEETGCALHVVHVSTARGLALIAEARAKGFDVTAETCPHYLLFTEDDVELIGALAKCAPPIRPAEEREALWEGIRDGLVQIVASDHSPAPASMKQSEDFFAIWGGISGCQSTLPVLLSEGVNGRGIGIELIAELIAGNVARRFNLPGKGRIEPGYDADFALVDLNAEQTLRAEDLRYLHKHSPYVGLTFKGTVRRTILRGRTIALDGQPVGEAEGQFVRPGAHSPSPLPSDVVG
jgi:allantoinase